MGVWIETIWLAKSTSLAKSHPVWVCGLKHKEDVNCTSPWTSHPVWVCGLKHLPVFQLRAEGLVTPCMGVWIETNIRAPPPNSPPVTPCMGVWIETKLPWCWFYWPNVTPCMGVWIETLHILLHYFQQLSHPVWVCGLKLNLELPSSSVYCHTLYGCVDWNLWLLLIVLVSRVTPCMGVWIETPSCWKRNDTITSHTLYGCVDWNRMSSTVGWSLISHTLYGCVDWNSICSHLCQNTQVTPCMGVWIETESTHQESRRS